MVLEEENRVDSEKFALISLRVTLRSYLARYPASEPRVFQSGPTSYKIFVANPKYSTPAELDYFHQNIRPVTALIDVVSVLPDEMECEVNVHGFLTEFEELLELHSLRSLEETLLRRNPHLSAIAISQGKNLDLTVQIPAGSPKEVLAAVNADLERLPWKPGSIKLLTSNGISKRTEDRSDVFSIAPLVNRSMSIARLAHVQQDEEVWRPKFAQAAAGELLTGDIYSRPTQSRAIFLPAIEIHRIPDIRNYFLLYDQVLIEMPLLAEGKSVFERMGLNADDLAQAAHRGRLKLVVTQPEERLDLTILKAVEGAGSNAIIGRRASAILAMARFAEQKKRFEKTSGKISEEIRLAISTLSDKFNLNPVHLERLLALPVANYYDGLLRLRDGDIKTVGVSSGLDVWKLISDLHSIQRLPELDLEFSIVGNLALKASLFDAEVAVGRGVNNPILFPLSACNVFSTLSTQQDLAGRGLIYPEGPMFAFQKKSIASLLDAVGSGNDTLVARSIFSELAVLPEAQRQQRIAEIVAVVEAYGGTRTGERLSTGMPYRWADFLVQNLGPLLVVLGISSAVSEVGLGAFGVFAAFRTGRAWFNDVAGIKSLGEDVSAQRKQVELLHRMRNVAWLEEETVR